MHFWHAHGTRSHSRRCISRGPAPIGVLPRSQAGRGSESREEPLVRSKHVGFTVLGMCFVFWFFGSVRFYWGSAKNSQLFATIPRVEMYLLSCKTKVA